MAHRDGPMVGPQYFEPQRREEEIWKPFQFVRGPRPRQATLKVLGPSSLLTRSGHESVAHVPTRALPRLNGLWTLTSTLLTVFREKRLEGQFLAFL
jgi:hypothetical protein